MPKWVSSVPGLKKSRGSSLFSNLMFIASVGLTAYALLAENKPPLELSLAASGALLGVKLIVDWTGRLRAKSKA